MTWPVEVKVLGCLRPGTLTVMIGYGHGMADGGIPMEIPIDSVPFDLRVPNSRFIVILEGAEQKCVAVERPPVP